MDLFIKELERLELDAMLVSCTNNVMYLSGFKGSAGVLFITREKCYLITDFRYLTQAKEQAKDFEIVDVAEGKAKIFKALCEKHNVKNNKHNAAKKNPGHIFALFADSLCVNKVADDDVVDSIKNL